MKKLIDIGTVTSIYPDRCTARVYFTDRNTVSSELHIGVRGSKATKDYWIPGLGEEVVCIFLPNSSDGFILCSYYGEDDELPVISKSKRHIQFEDGAFIEYDSGTHTLNFDFTNVKDATVIFKNCKVIESR